MAARQNTAPHATSDSNWREPLSAMSSSSASARPQASMIRYGGMAATRNAS